MARPAIFFSTKAPEGYLRGRRGPLRSGHDSRTGSIGKPRGRESSGPKAFPGTVTAT